MHNVQYRAFKSRLDKHWLFSESVLCSFTGLTEQPNAFKEVVRTFTSLLYIESFCFSNLQA